MPAIESLGPFEQLILTAVEALKDSAYGAQVHDTACEFAEKEPERRFGLRHAGAFVQERLCGRRGRECAFSSAGTR